MDRIIEGMRTLPAYMHAGLRRYLEHGVEPGGFLLALLEGRINDAMARADSANRAALDCGAWGTFLRDHMPAGSWGNPTMVRAWSDHRGLSGIRQAN